MASTAIFSDAGPPSRPRRQEAGFTLTESLIAAAIGAFLLAGILSSYIMTARGFRAISNYWEIHGVGRYAIDRFASDMRGVSAITSFAANGPVTVTIPVAFSGSGLSISNRTVTYTFSNNALLRTDSSVASTKVLATNVSQCTFSLYDRLGSNTTVLSVAKGIRLELFLRKSVANQQQTEDYLSARLNMRNKK